MVIIQSCIGKVQTPAETMNLLTVSTEFSKFLLVCHCFGTVWNHKSPALILKSLLLRQSLTFKDAITNVKPAHEQIHPEGEMRAF